MRRIDDKSVRRRRLFNDFYRSGIDQVTAFHIFYLYVYPIYRCSIMKALSNAHPLRGGEKPRYAGFASNIIPESESFPKGVSSNFVPLANHYWFVFRVTYNQIDKASEAFKEKQISTYFPQHYVLKNIKGKKKRMLAPLLPNFIFAYTTRNKADSMVRKDIWTSAFLKYYLDKTKERESNGFHPPLTIQRMSMS